MLAFDPAVAAGPETDAPTWDMSVFFPSLDSAELASAIQGLQQDVDQLKAFFAGEGVAKGAPQSGTDGVTLDHVIWMWNEAAAQFRLVSAYISSFISTDTTNELAQGKNSELDALRAERSKLGVALSAWIGSRSDAALASSSQAKEHAWAVEKAKVTAQHQMSSAEEELAADLAQTGTNAWGRLHSDITSQMRVELDGQMLPMPVVRNLAYDPDRGVRQRAYHAELAAWKTVEVTCAAAMNGIKGEQGVLARKRGWGEPLDIAVFDCNMDRRTLDAMMDAAKASFPMFRRYLRAKARLVNGDERLSWLDIYAPCGEEGGAWSYAEGAEFVAQQFDTFSPKMGEFARKAVRENWIDARPAPNKVGGAFCMGARGGESRLLQTWKTSFGAVATLAHELGHGYHNLCLADRTMIQRETPMTLAETASIFCETIVTNAALKSASDAVALGIVESSLQRSLGVVVDISSRFLFEREVFQRRQKRALSASEFCEIMLWAQEETYGDGLSTERHPYMWAVKPHYYSSRGFYNFPYMFGQLFALGLYSEYQKDPEKFKGMYDDLLSSTGLAPAAQLASRFGIDITDQKFWAGSLETVAREVDEFVRLSGN